MDSDYENDPDFGDAAVLDGDEADVNGSLPHSVSELQMRQEVAEGSRETLLDYQVGGVQRVLDWLLHGMDEGLFLCKQLVGVVL